MLPDTGRAQSYRKARWIGLFLSLFQFFIIVWLAHSRTLAADLVHTFLDFLTLFFTAALLSYPWKSEDAFKKSYRRVLLFGVLSLALGGFIIAFESIHHLWEEGAAIAPPAWPVFLAGIVSILGNLTLHRILEGDEKGVRDALHKNNIDHILTDLFLSIATLMAAFSMWYWKTAAFDHYIAIFVGLVVLPYFAWKRWKEREYTDEHDHEGSDHHHH